MKEVLKLEKKTQSFTTVLTSCKKAIGQTFTNICKSNLKVLEISSELPGLS